MTPVCIDLGRQLFSSTCLQLSRWHFYASLEASTSIATLAAVACSRYRYRRRTCKPYLSRMRYQMPRVVGFAARPIADELSMIIWEDVMLRYDGDTRNGSA